MLTLTGFETSDGISQVQCAGGSARLPQQKTTKDKEALKALRALKKANLTAAPVITKALKNNGASNPSDGTIGAGEVTAIVMSVIALLVAAIGAVSVHYRRKTAGNSDITPMEGVLSKRVRRVLLAPFMCLAQAHTPLLEELPCT